METTNERITLRLQEENVKALDSFLDEHEEFRSRSELCRKALDEYMKERSKESAPKGRDVRIKVPLRYFELMLGLVEEGYYTSVEFIINKLIEEHFSKDNLKGREELRTEIDKVTGKPVITLGDRDELIPR
ncbi:MAG: hypothetical protein KAI64_02870 [Thermoplasmata archaeon]|nr:hypothetical protein [Thermoplasmata archaeon]